MPDYKYRALNPLGRVQRGELSALSPHDLQHQLGQAGMALIESRLLAQRGRRRFSLVSAGGSHLQQLAQFCTHVAQLERAAVRLTDTLRDVASALPPGQLRHDLSQVIDRVENGSSLSQALTLHAASFPAPMPALVAAGEATGRMADTFAQLSTHFEWRAKLRAKLTRVLAYPLLSLVTMLGVVSFLIGYVVPQTSSFLHDMGIKLAPHTLALLATARFVDDDGATLATLLLCSLLGIVIVYRRSPAFALYTDRKLLRLPLAGTLLRKLELARFTRSLAMLVESEIELLLALEIAARTVRNRALSETLGIMRNQIGFGTPLSRAAQLSGEFPSLVRRMLSIGEQGGRLGGALVNVADHYESAVQRSAEDLVTAIGPAVTIVTGGLLVWLVTAIFLPIYDALPQLM